MEEKIYNIYQSELEKARDTDDSAWQKNTFSRAEDEINSGGKVHILQRFSDASTELVAIIDTLDMLEYYREKYAPKPA